MIDIIVASHPSGIFLYILFPLTEYFIDVFSDLGIMLSVFEQPDLDHSKTRADSMIGITVCMYVCMYYVCMYVCVCLFVCLF